MLQRPADRVSYCYAKAAESRQRAVQTHNQDIKDELLRQEDRWIQLAQSLEFTRRLADFVVETERFITEADRRITEADRRITEADRRSREEYRFTRN